MKPAPGNNFFDGYAGDYEALLREMVGGFDDPSYFASYKIEILLRKLAIAPARVLDFGTGVGRSLPFFRAAFPTAELHGFDPSQESLAYAARACPVARLHARWETVGAGYDLVFLAGVLHHLPPEEAPDWLARLRAVTAPGGTVAIFEHNLRNPVTRRLVRRSPYDRDARFYSPAEVEGLLAGAGWREARSEYCLFFPALLRALRPLEKRLGRWPCGGQFFTLGRR